MSRKWCILSLLVSRAAAMECTGASPQRWGLWKFDLLDIPSRDIPRSRTLLSALRNQSISDTPLISKSQDPRSQSCSRLDKPCEHICCPKCRIRLTVAEVIRVSAIFTNEVYGVVPINVSRMKGHELYGQGIVRGIQEEISLSARYLL